MATPQLHAQTTDSDGFVDELKPGTRLLHGQYTIDSFLNAGGFGITYLARDSLDRKVVIKECFPGAFCRRSRYVVQARSRAHQNELKSIVRLFVQEARSLAKLDHPNIVGVHQVFEDNETAYMALDYIEGRDLLDVIEDPQTALTPAEVVAILREILGAVGFIHAQGMLHRDISPDNILIARDNRPVLIDFGAAREQASKQSRVLSALRVVKDGYSPQEFYIAGSDQSPSSDLYALAASFHHLLTGDLPPNSQSRLAAIASGEADPYVPLVGRLPDYDRLFLAALDKALSVLPKDRLQSAQAWIDMMDGVMDKTALSAAADTPAPKRGSRLPLLVGAAAVLALALAGAVLLRPDAAGDDTATAATAVTQDSAPPATATVATASAAAVLPDAPTLPAMDRGAAPALPATAMIAPVSDRPTPPLALPGTPDLVMSVGSGPVVDIPALVPGAAISPAGLETDISLRLPFVAAGARSNIIAAAVDGTDWVRPGLVVTDVNGAAISAIADITATLQTDPDLTFDAPSVTVTFGLRDPETNARLEEEATLPVVQSLRVPAGYRFDTSFADDNWRTIVGQAPAATQGALQTGDVVMTYIPTATPITDRASLAALLEAEVAQGTANFIFAVQRDGSMWVAAMAFPDGAN